MPPQRTDHNSAIDWPGIRAAAVLLGVREAARQAARNLPDIEQNRFVKRVLKRSEREHWLRSKVSSLSPSLRNTGLPLSSNVVTGQEAAFNSLESMSAATRSALAKVAMKSAQRAANKADKRPLVVSSTKDLRELTASAAQIGGWNEDQQQHQTLVNVNILNS